MHDLDNGGEARVAFFAQRLVEPFSGDAGVAGELHHAARPCDVAHGFGEQGGGVGDFVNIGLQVLRAVIVRLQVIGGLGCCSMSGR